MRALMRGPNLARTGGHRDRIVPTDRLGAAEIAGRGRIDRNAVLNGTTEHLATIAASVAMDVAGATGSVVAEGAVAVEEVVPR